MTDQLPGTTALAATITGACYTTFDYHGHLDPPIVAARLDLRPRAGEGVEPFSQFYAVGGLDRVALSLDGKHYEGARAGIEAPYVLPYRYPDEPAVLPSSNWATFLGAARAAGLPEVPECDGLSYLRGLSGVFLRRDFLLPASRRFRFGSPWRTVLVLVTLHDCPGVRRGAP